MGNKNIDKVRRKTAAGFIAAGIALLLILNPFGAGRNILTGAGLSFAASENNEAFTPPAWPQEHSDLRPDADLYFGRLENGFRFVLMQNKNPQDRVSMHLDVQAGSAYETDDQQGLAHFLEHLLFCGSENFAPGELVKYFQSIGMQFGADANAHTGFYETVYDILLPRGDEENLRQGLKVMKDYAQGALLLPSEIDRERNVILAEKRARDSAAGRTYEATIKFELPEAIISRRLPIGKEDVIQRATQADLKAYYDTWYRPDTMVLVAVGDFRIPAAATLIREYFSDMRARSKPVPPLPFGEIRHNGLEAFHHYEKESGNTTVTLEVLTKETQTADTIDRRKEQVKKEMADQIVQNRLDAMISRGGAPGTSAAIGSGVYLNHVRYAMVTAEGEPGNWEQLLAFLEKTVRKAIRYGFTEAELERVRRDFLAELDQESRVKDKIHDSNTDIVQIDYANGFRLNLKRTTYKNDEILASLAFGRGRSQEPAEHPGLADLATSVINESGLGRLTQDELDAALAGKQTRVSFSIQTSAFVFNGESVPEEMELLFQLLYSHVMDPGFRSNAYQLSMAQFKSRYESISHTLEGAMVLDGNRFLAGGDSRFG
ncbi:MAG: pitrilysin family protein [Deltaproteobacteria bacterium]